VNFARRTWREAIAALVVLATRVVYRPHSVWELDEPQFALAVIDFDPTKYHPHPPGCPLFVGLGKVVYALVGDAFLSLVIVSILACAIGVVALSAAFRRWLGDADLAVAGALLFYLSAGMLVQTNIAMADALTLMFVALFLYATTFLGEEMTDRRALLLGVWAAAAIGARPQIAIPMLPALAVALWFLTTWRRRAIALGAFTFVCLMCFLPLIEGTGGIPEFIAYQRKQAEYFVAHDASQSRGTTTFPQIVARFVFHPWGSKYVALPLFACVAIGAAGFVKRFDRRFAPLVVFCGTHLLFALVAMDPADGVRYTMPSMIVFALAAAFGFDVLRRIAQFRAMPWIAVAAIAALAWAYARPVLAARASGPAAVAAAADYATRHFSPDTVILYDLSNHPFSDYLLPRFRRMPIDAGLRAYYDRPQVPLVLYVDGGSRAPDAKVFGWPDSDAYRKLTRNVYRQSTLDPVFPRERYLPLAGVYALERTVAGAEWRWLAKEASIRLPRTHTPAVELQFGLSPDVPYAANRVRVRVNGSEAGEVNVPRGGTAAVTAPLPPVPDIVVSISAEQSFAPATVLGNKDPRILAVQLLRIDQR
jgi:Dolichyl-phosphate-mannose-protein mannosyltransferase